jgi:hypothetical protein
MHTVQMTTPMFEAVRKYIQLFGGRGLSRRCGVPKSTIQRWRFGVVNEVSSQNWHRFEAFVKAHQKENPELPKQPDERPRDSIDAQLWKLMTGRDLKVRVRDLPLSDLKALIRIYKICAVEDNNFELAASLRDLEKQCQALSASTACSCGDRCK